MTVPIKLVLSPRVVAPFGVQNTLHADAPLLSVIVSLAVVSSAPSDLKI